MVVSDLLRRRPEWAAATGRLRHLVAEHGNDAAERAKAYGDFYAGRRGAMVVDVVSSRQRPYEKRVLPLVEKWQGSVATPSLATLAAGIDREVFGLRPSEPPTMVTVARNLLALGDQLGLNDDDSLCRSWAQGVGPLAHGYRLDPVVGGVPGIGMALFSYMRMRSGANALKPDLRVRRALKTLGFYVPSDAHSILVVAEAAAAEIDTDLLALDQLLWWAGGR